MGGGGGGAVAALVFPLKFVISRWEGYLDTCICFWFIPILSISVLSTILTIFPISSTHIFPFLLFGIFVNLCSHLKITMHPKWYTTIITLSIGTDRHLQTV